MQEYAWPEKCGGERQRARKRGGDRDERDVLVQTVHSPYLQSRRCLASEMLMVAIEIFFRSKRDDNLQLNIS